MALIRKLRIIYPDPELKIKHAVIIKSSINFFSSNKETKKLREIRNSRVTCILKIPSLGDMAKNLPLGDINLSLISKEFYDVEFHFRHVEYK